MRTLEDFLSKQRWPNNSYVKHPEFKELYVKHGPIAVVLKEKTYRVNRCVTIGNITAKKPGQGAFTRLFEDLKKQGFAIHVECVHNERFQRKLTELGFALTFDKNYVYHTPDQLVEWDS